MAHNFSFPFLAVFEARTSPVSFKTRPDLTGCCKRLSLNYNVLDVRSTKWPDDYSNFKAGVKDLEVMTQNVINGAFEQIATMKDGVELLLAFDSPTKLSIRRCVEKKTSDMFSMFALAAKESSITLNRTGSALHSIWRATSMQRRGPKASGHRVRSKCCSPHCSHDQQR